MLLHNDPAAYSIGLSRQNNRSTTNGVRSRRPSHAPRARIEALEQRRLLSAVLASAVQSVVANVTSGSISGVAYNDANRNQVHDTGEQGLSGWTVYIDQTNSGVYKSNDPITTTDSSGQYTFSNLSAGTWIARVIPPTGWQQTIPLHNYGQHVTISSGGSATGADFGFYHAAIVVNTHADSTDPPTSTTVSLRDAIAQANSAQGPVTITFDPNVFTSSNSGITLGGSQLELSGTGGPVTIIGPNTALVTIDANYDSRAFMIDAGVTASIIGVSIANGQAPIASDGNARGGGLYNDGILTLSAIFLNCVAAPHTSDKSSFGGGIFNAGTLTLHDVSCSNCEAKNARDGLSGGNYNGGGIYNGGTLDSSGLWFSKCDAQSGGGIYNATTLNVSDGDVSNCAADVGGGIYNSGTANFSALTMEECRSELIFYPGDARGGGIYNTGTLSLSTATVSTSRATAGGTLAAGASFDAYGGGIWSSGTLSVTNCTITANQATGSPVLNNAIGEDFWVAGSAEGGGLYASGPTTITQSMISNNLAAGGGENVPGNLPQPRYDIAVGGDARGGGVFCGASLILTSSKILNNTAIGGYAVDGYSGNFAGEAQGGGIFCSLGASITACTLTANQVFGGDAQEELPRYGGALGGAVYSSGATNIQSSTVVENQAFRGGPFQRFDHAGSGGPGSGGGISTAAAVTGYNSTIVGNSPDGLSCDPSQKNLLINTIVSGNQFSDVDGALASQSSYNLIGIGGGLTNGVNGNQVGVTDPKLMPLGNYGGPTLTMLPMPGSPAIDAGSNALIPSGVTTDQRGMPRISESSVDIGADETTAASISGTFFYDSNFNGKWDPGEPVSPLWGVYIDVNQDGKQDTGDIYVRADASGKYTFTGLAAGTYTIRPATASGWTVTYPASGIQTVTVSATQIVSNINFGEYHGAVPPGSISGTFFYDSNANGKWDSGEAISPLWGVYIDVNHDGKQDTGDIYVRADSNGKYTFTGLAAGTYTIRPATASGWTVTSPASGAQIVTIGSGQSITNINFGEYHGVVPPASISGTFFYDFNGNGKWDTGESISPSWGVYIDVNKDGKQDAGDIYVRANASGKYVFDGLAAGTYVIRAATATGWQQTFPTSGGAQVITLSSGQAVTGVNFGERRIG